MKTTFLPSTASLVLGIAISTLATVHAEDGWQYWFKDGLGDAKVVTGTTSYKVENGV